MICQQFRKKVWDYIEGRLPPGEKQRFFQHLETCADCQHQLKVTERLRGLLKIKPEERPPDSYWSSFWPRLQEMIRAEEAFSQQRFSRRVWSFRLKPAYAIAVVSAVVVFILVYAGILLFQPVPTVTTPAVPRLVEIHRPFLSPDCVLAPASRSLGVKTGEMDFILCQAGGPIGEEAPERDFVLAPAVYPGGEKKKSDVSLAQEMVIGPPKSDLAGIKRFSGNQHYVFACGFTASAQPRIFW